MTARGDWIRAAGNRIHADLRRELERQRQGPQAVVAGLLSGWRHRRIPILIELGNDSELDAVCRALSACGCTRVRPVRLVGLIAAEAAPEAIRRALEDRRIRRLRLDRQVRALLDVATPTVRAPAVWAAGARGRGVTVAVLDTGIYPHPDFTQPVNRLLAFHDVVSGRREPFDPDGHGTHVAGIIAGNGRMSGGRYVGCAPEAGLVGVRVLDDQGLGRLSHVLAGLDWVVAHRRELAIRVVNLSLGSLAVDPPGEDPLVQAVEAAWRSGLVVCTAAGNSGPEPGTIDTPGIAPSVITVGAVDDHGTTYRGDDTVAAFSSRGPALGGAAKPDLVAPGVHITAAAAPGSRTAARNRLGTGAYVTMSGTSMATPMVAGLAALLLSVYPELGPDRVKALLIGGCSTLRVGPDAEGRGLVDGATSLRLAGSTGPPGDRPPA
ncbi:MAG TPA: S8 family peptidase [Bacillota bacterium]